MPIRIMPMIIILLLVACSTTPSFYAPFKDKAGYSDEIIDTNLRMASFQGNSSTKKDSAELYAKFRAIEICRELGRTFTHILMVKDKTFSKDTTQVTSSGPNYYYGTSPYYGRYGASMSYAPTSTTVSSETYTYPLFEVYFECVEKPMDARISLKNLSQSQMQNLVKDLQGAVQVDDILNDSPNKGKLQKGDIITKANDERVSTVLQAYQVAREAKQENLKVEFFRDGVKKIGTVSFLDVSELVGQAQKEIIKKACEADSLKGKNPLCK